MITIGIAGPTASGKSTLARRLKDTLSSISIEIIGIDNFYRELSEEEHKIAALDQYNFDDPDSLDWDLLSQTLIDLKNNQKVKIPTWDFKTHSRGEYFTLDQPPSILILEGIYALKTELDVKIYMAEDRDVCLSRRVIRDTLERGRSIESVINQWNTSVRPSFELVEQQQKKADLIIHGSISANYMEMLQGFLQIKLMKADGTNGEKHVKVKINGHQE